MNELIVIKKETVGNEEVNSVDARELWEFLGSKRQFGDWVGRRN
jgi:phage anti-repressor protein